AHGRGRH
ncbi:hypothetical protein BN1723_020877, partial [Verticillium longisporum]